MATSPNSGVTLDKARRRTHHGIGKVIGWIMLLASIPFSILGWIGVHFSYSMKWFVGMGCIFFSLLWSTENYYLGHNGGLLLEDIASGGINFSMVMSFFLTCLVQHFQMEGARERVKAAATRDLPDYRPDNVLITFGYFLYGVEIFLAGATFSYRAEGGGMAILIAILIGIISIWGFEIGVMWIERKD